MRAAFVEELGRRPALREAGEPEGGHGEVLVEITAAPLNPIDLSIASGRFYAGAPEMPYIPGVEGLGRVLEGGHLDRGARVYVEAGGGRGGPGSLAERVAVPQGSLVPVPDGPDDALAACFGVAGLAAWLALEWRAGLRAGETVLVLGASGAVGQIAVQAGHLLGASRVVAAARSREGRERASELGADTTVRLPEDPRPEELAEELRAAAGGDGFDVVVDPLWGPPAVAAAEACAPHARLVQLGQSAGAESTVASATIRGRALSILGHTNFLAPAEVRADAYRRMVEHAAAGSLTVDHETVALDDVAAAWERQTESPQRKLVVVP